MKRRRQLEVYRNQQELNHKIKADRLQRILGQEPAPALRSGVPGPPPRNTMTSSLPAAAAQVVTQVNPGPSGASGPSIVTPTSEAQMTCPHHPQERLVQVRNKLIGNDIFRCPQVLCGYELNAEESSYNQQRAH